MLDSVFHGISFSYGVNFTSFVLVRYTINVHKGLMV